MHGLHGPQQNRAPYIPNPESLKRSCLNPELKTIKPKTFLPKPGKVSCAGSAQRIDEFLDQVVAQELVSLLQGVLCIHMGSALNTLSQNLYKMTYLVAGV